MSIMLGPLFCREEEEEEEEEGALREEEEEDDWSLMKVMMNSNSLL